MTTPISMPCGTYTIVANISVKYLNHVNYLPIVIVAICEKKSRLSVIATIARNMQESAIVLVFYQYCDHILQRIPSNRR